MHKTLTALITAVLIISSSFMSFADTPAPSSTASPSPAPEITVNVNGRDVAWKVETDGSVTKPFIDGNNRTLVPLRAVADYMGVSVEWDENKRAAVFTRYTETYVTSAGVIVPARKAESISFPIDSASAGEAVRVFDESDTEIAEYRSDRVTEMDTAAVISNGRTYAPVKYLAEFFGFSVGWTQENYTVTLLSKDYGSFDQTITPQAEAEIVKAMEEALTYSWDWFVDNIYADKSQSITAEVDGVKRTFYRVKLNDVKTIDDVKKIAKNFYTESVAESCYDMHLSWLERDGSLYVTGSDGLGGVFPDTYDIAIKPINEDKFAVTAYPKSSDSPDVRIDSFTVNFVNTGNGWRFDRFMAMYKGFKINVIS